MLTKPIAKTFWHKFCQFPNPNAPDVVRLMARAALMVYRKEGRKEAHTFIQLIRLHQWISNR